jgi:outer membrane protein OmpA-like peptidoglycan-associated protein
MSIDRRQSERSDIFLNVELKPFKKTITECHGVTDNISCGGLSLGSQGCDFKPGEIMEMKLKHPQSDLSFSVEGKIVWKREAWYKSVTGIEFEDIDKDRKSGIAEFITEIRNRDTELFYSYTNDETADNQKVENGPEEETAVGRKDELIRETFKEDIDAELNESGKGVIPLVEGSSATASAIDGFVDEVINKVESGGKNGSLRTGARAKDRRKKGRLYIVLPAVLIVVSAIVLSVNYEGIRQGVMNLISTAKSIPFQDAGKRHLAISEEDISTHSMTDEEFVGPMQAHKAFDVNNKSPEKEKTDALIPAHEASASGQDADNEQTSVIADNAQPDNLTKLEDRFPAENIKGNIGFSRNSDVVESSFYPAIDRIVDLLLKYPETSVRLAGHTDNVGPGIYNVYLSAKRAAAVKGLLVGRGVAASRIETEGLGDSIPVSSNDTWRGRAGNRRVEIEVVPAD